MFDIPAPVSSKPHPPSTVAQWCRDLAAEFSPVGFIVRTMDRIVPDYVKMLRQNGLAREQVDTLVILWEHARISAPNKVMPNLLEGPVTPERAINWLHGLAEWLTPPAPALMGEADALTIARENGIDVSDRNTRNRVKVWFTNYAKKNLLCRRPATESGPVRHFYRRDEVVPPLRAAFLTRK